MAVCGRRALAVAVDAARRACHPRDRGAGSRADRLPLYSSVTSDEALGMWQAYSRKWESATRSVLDPALQELVPALAQFAPPAKSIDKPVYSAFATE
jgi:hypothetical protein